MGITKLVLAALIIAVSGLSIATGETTTNPSEVLEGARRDRIEQDKRLDRDTAEQQQRDKEINSPLTKSLLRDQPTTYAALRRFGPDMLWVDDQFRTSSTGC